MKLVRHCLVAVMLFSLGCAATPEPPPPPPPPATPTPPPPPPPDPRTFSAAVQFDAGSAQLSDPGIRELTRFATKLRPYPERRVHVVGYSEAGQIETENPWLSEQRAKNVAAFLVFLLDASQLKFLYSLLFPLSSSSFPTVTRSR